ncbi:hypothetical protein NL532_24120 [Mesorhizobium sp. C120A]|uniref:sigma factor-like helix-turn-helix DNA-binding protein n=1 Tax=unclassified Mesorhizobium TaxID=325217 RepID=UPI0004038E61|nr:MULTISPECIES: sigma factor-like helix-turn-helix DNA-binding protein [unclassified Mesorhizobium]WJI43696.1 hypothetical protein NL532_24120 [Mesorhizobium sp. C120A]
MKRLIGYAGRDSGGEWRGDDSKCQSIGAMERADRRSAILIRHNNGDSHVEIASAYGITRERVRQIVAAAGGIPRRGKQRPKAGLSA